MNNFSIIKLSWIFYNELNIQIEKKREKMVGKPRFGFKKNHNLKWDSAFFSY